MGRKTRPWPNLQATIQKCVTVHCPTCRKPAATLHPHASSEHHSGTVSPHPTLSYYTIKQLLGFSCVLDLIRWVGRSTNHKMADFIAEVTPHCNILQFLAALALARRVCVHNFVVTCSPLPLSLLWQQVHLGQDQVLLPASEDGSSSQVSKCLDLCVWSKHYQSNNNVNLWEHFCWCTDLEKLLSVLWPSVT